MKTVIKIGLGVGGAFVTVCLGKAMYAAIMITAGIHHRYGEEEGRKLMRELALEGFNAIYYPEKKEKTE